MQFIKELGYLLRFFISFQLIIYLIQLIFINLSIRYFLFIIQLQLFMQLII